MSTKRDTAKEEKQRKPTTGSTQTGKKRAQKVIRRKERKKLRVKETPQGRRGSGWDSQEGLGFWSLKIARRKEKTA